MSSGKVIFQSIFSISSLYLLFIFMICGKNNYQTPLIGPQRPSWCQRKILPGYYSTHSTLESSLARNQPQLQAPTVCSLFSPPHPQETFISSSSEIHMRYKPTLLCRKHPCWKPMACSGGSCLECQREVLPCYCRE